MLALFWAASQPDRGFEWTKMLKHNNSVGLELLPWPRSGSGGVLGRIKLYSSDLLPTIKIDIEDQRAISE